MRKPVVIKLEDKALISVQGPDARSFLQGLISNDVEKAGVEQAVYSALLTPQGKFLLDFLILQPENDKPDLLWLEVDQTDSQELVKRLSLFKLRSQVEVRLVEPAKAHFAILGQTNDLETEPGWILVDDPRHEELGKRLIIDLEAEPSPLPSDLEVGERDFYEEQRIKLAIPRNKFDLIPEKTTLMEAGFDHLNGLDWDKGCYMGQEVTARTKYRGLVKRRMIPLKASADVLSVGSNLVQGEKKVGTITSAAGHWALASLTIKAARSNIDDDFAIDIEGSDAAVELAPPAWLSPLLESDVDD